MEKEQPGRFQYTPLRPGFIRLLRILPESTVDNIQCQMIDHEIIPGTRGGFTALSYCWYDPTHVATIMVDGKPLGVAQNLLDFLQNRFLHNRMFSHDPEGKTNMDLWVDAICINQADDDEKSEQVKRMWQIYSTSAITIAWLGKEKEYTSKAFFALNTKVVEIMMNTEAPQLIQKMVEDSKPKVVELSDDPYFSRTWIVQEVICSESRLWLQSGKYSAPFSSLYPFSALSKGTIATQGSIKARTKDGLNICAESLLYTMERNGNALRADLTTDQGRWDMVHALMTLIMDHKNKQCFDIRDKIFAFTGLPPARALENNAFPPLNVDYSMTLDEVAVATLSYMDLLELSTGDRYHGTMAPFVVIGLFQVDIASDDFRHWLEGRLVRDEEKGTLEFLTTAGKRINCLTPIFEEILEKRVNKMTMVLTGRMSEAATLEGREYIEDVPRDPKFRTAFPGILAGKTRLKGRVVDGDGEDEHTPMDTSVSESDGTAEALPWAETALSPKLRALSRYTK